jgi:hypothetical protein
MNKIIEYPESTTEIVEVRFHIVKDRREVENIFAGVKADEVSLFRKAVDHVTFQPMYYITIQKPNRHAEYYRVILEWIVDVQRSTENDELKLIYEKLGATKSLEFSVMPKPL